jgi:DNA-binding NarL/FixJ family response regulator
MYAEDACLAQATRPVHGPNARCDATAGTASISVMACSDGAALHATMRAVQADAPGIRLLAGPCDGDTCLRACASPTAPQLLLLDKDWLDIADARLLRRLRERCPQMRILLAWDRVPPTLVADVAHHRLDGFVPAGSPPEVYRKAIETVIQGELWLSRELMARAIEALHAELRAVERHDVERHVATPPADIAGTLTPRETEVVIHLRRGFTNKEIARELGIMEDTVKKHLQNIFAKLGVNRRTLVALSLCS